MIRGLLVSSVLAGGGLLACESFESAALPSADGGTTAAVDAGPDAGPPAGDRRFCAAHPPPEHCFDFDGTPDVAEGFVATMLAGGGALTASAAARSAPRALLVVLPALTGGASAPRAGLELPLGVASGVRLELAVAYETLGAACTSTTSCLASLAEIKRPGHVLTLYADQTRTIVQDFDIAENAATEVQLPARPLGTWFHVVIDARFDLRRADVSLDDASLGAVELAPDDVVSGTVTTVRIGIGNTNDSRDSWRIRYDDVVVRPL